MKTYKMTALSILLLLLGACGADSANEEETEELTVYTTVFPLKSFTESIGGDTVQVESIYPTGADVHTYEPTQKDILNYAEGDLFIYTSKALDPVSKKIEGSIGDHTEFFSAADSIPESAYLHTEHDHDEHAHEEAGDPHIWLDPKLSIEMAKSIQDQLIEMNPDHEELYRDNYEALEDDLESIHDAFTEVTEQTERDTVYISHASLGYLANRYHFNQVGISGLNNEELSQQELTQIVEEIKAHDVPYILYEQNITSKIADTVKNETGIEPLEFHNLSVLYDSDEKDATYQSVMRQNVEVIDKALND
ncbi:metal ABC transporter solute-binding protein, Zn/Mn family [Salinicoccus siamensis]|uniref:Metal ABC transporter solute-binding protein, Zn/Mn family n=1 Tax=Salinicoccus siamensis TaxID=381830 RepID=A0ABV5Z7Q3_9STAP